MMSTKRSLITLISLVRNAINICNELFTLKVLPIDWCLMIHSHVSRLLQLCSAWTIRHRVSTTLPVWPSAMAQSTAGKMDWPNTPAFHFNSCSRCSAVWKHLIRGLLDVKAGPEIGFSYQTRPVHGTMRLCTGTHREWKTALSDKVHQYWEQYQYTHFHIQDVI